MGRKDQYHRRAIDSWKNLVIAVLCLTGNVLHGSGQSLIDPITRSTTQFGQVNSDYGPRHIPAGTNPHVGIDYQLSQGGKAYAVAGGTIDKIVQAGVNSYIMIGPWRYFHMYTGEYPDYTWGVYPADYQYGCYYNVIFIREYQSGKLNTVKALTDSPSLTSIKDTITKQFIPATRIVSAGDLVFRSNGENHLHIDYSPNGLLGWENPFRFIAHENDYSPTVFLWPQKNLGTQAQDFPDSNVYGQPLLLTAMMNVSHDKDFDQMRLSVVPLGGVESVLRTYRYEHHGLSGVPIHVLLNTSQILTRADTGIYPFNSGPSQDFFKYHFASRVDALGNQALCNLECRFPDGRTSLYARGTDISGLNTTDEKKVILDNFKPFVRGVSVNADHLLYSAWADWNAYTDQLTWTIFPTNSSSSGMLNVHVTVHTSEPMRAMSMDFADPSILAGLSDHSMHPANLQRTEWSIMIPFTYLYTAIQAGKTGFQHMSIQGTDLAGNALCLPEFPGPTPGSALPHRNNDGSWTGNLKTQADDHHGFFLGSNPNASSLQAGFVGIPVLGTSPLTVNFVDVSTGNPDQWQWNFGNGMTWTGKYPPPVTYTNLTSDPLNYSASLTIADANGQPSQCFRVDYVTVLPQSMGNGGANASFSFDQLNLAVPSYVCFTNTSSGDISGVYWDFDDGSSSTAHSPVHIFNAPGFYDVVLTITDLAGQAYQQEQTVYVYPPFNSALAVDFGVRGPAVAGDFTRFDDLCSGGPSFARKLWDFGDGTLAEVLGVPLHLYYSPGVYQVRLEVRDYLDNLLGVAMKNVTVIPDALNDLTADLNQLVPTDPALNDMFGLAVATDREWAFIGAPHDDDQGSASGSVYVYKLNPDSTWTFFQKIALSNGSKDDYFGHALDFDGQRLIAGAPGNSSSSHGKAAIFQFNGSSWVETLLISCPSTKNYYFGWAVSIDHGILCIGAPSHTQALPGAAWVYKENGGSWALETKLEDANASLPDRFGYAVDIQGDHAITTLYHPTATDEIWFWKKTAGVWQTVSKRFQDNASGVSLDCPLAVCGDTWNNRVVLYAFDGSQWHVDDFVVPADGNSGNTNFGQSAALRGRYLLAGKPGDGTLAPSGGSMYLFRRNDTGDWIQWKKFTPSSPEAYEYYGWSVSLSSSHALAGAFGWKGNRGSAYMVNDVIPPCERVRDWCHLDLYTGQHLADDCGELRLGGDGCMVNLWPGSGGLWYSRNIDLLPGLTLYAGSEATFIPVDCSLFSPGLKMGCPCPPGSQGNTDVHRSTAEVTLYPNPTFGTFTLSWPEGMGRAQVSLMGQDGRKIKDLGESGTGQTYNLPAIGNGVYLLTLRFADTIRAIRLIKI